jgi:hypothetical protein
MVAAAHIQNVVHMARRRREESRVSTWSKAFRKAKLKGELNSRGRKCSAALQATGTKRF